MSATRPISRSFASVRPLVRYVDDEQAVVEVHFLLQPKLSTGRRAAFPGHVDVRLSITHEDGFNDEERFLVPIQRGSGMVRMKLVRPRLWWPVGMGEQSLYQVELQLLKRHQPAAVWSGSIGLTSVRPGLGFSDPEPSCLLINGQDCRIRKLMPIDAPDEQSFLPISGQSLLVIRGHYGPDVLFEAADRAGILLLQCVPLSEVGDFDREVPPQVERLATHPSLAGWYVGHLGDTGRRVAEQIRTIDPTHSVFMRLPAMDAA